MVFLIFTLGFLLSPNLVAGNFSYDGTNGPSHWGKEYKTCLGKYQSPIDIEEKDVTTMTFPELQFSGVEGSHKAYMTNNGHTVMIQSFDSNVPSISGGPINSTYVFQQLHFHWGPNDNQGSEDLINNHSFSMELHVVLWKKEYGSYDEAIKRDDGLTVLGYLYQATDEPNPMFESIVQQIPDIVGVGSNITISDNNVLKKLVAPDIASAQNYFTYRGSLTTPPCLEIVQWIDFVKPQHISHEQLAAFRSIQSADGTNLTHNFRPVQPLDGRTVYRNIAGAEPSTISPVFKQTPSTASVPASSPAKKQETINNDVTESPMDNNKNGENSASSMWPVTPFAVILGVIFLLPYQ
ncbi:carbonic anhydrase 2-like [Frieseomelitta varia]|uniref:carbonic anhydrase 2-like n=1 Tax=Frieseomelitta varia TaxID=561572 RepID=UPI001CB6AF1E|nr:carbonic anhydrase 2-like [Frieseomelitta varia]